ncbi:unnamed protein product [Notodromas monacha]|uniref:Large ribosomal subunit protein uL4 C-terminal domain-containing protein n=1 Tax=Notodromas monacha TaxID=399045 RepID=A0A7R9GBA8_9CRUS|nr:unnamed protein product [Notodromas monacha]CAG0914619.1 unnamed protein product [Notodromas monacha]
MSVVITRPLVTVFNEKNEKVSSVKLPAVFRAPIRPDIVSFIHHEIAKNNRQPYSVSKLAGHQTSAESWGTGRAVARIPRVRGGGTHRSGQGAFGNMCRGGRMFAPTKTWRRWHRKVNVSQKRYALCSALAASGVPSLVFARGHAIQQLSEIPFVVSDKIQEYVKTKQACFFLKKSKIWPEIEKVLASKRFRAGRGKMRNRRRIQKRGPLIIYDRDQGLTRAFRNIPGIDLQNVNNMNLLRLAPGGHVGRLCIWTESAFRKLDDICGTWKTPSKVKTGFILPRHIMQMTDLQRLINSEEVKKVVRKPRRKVVRRTVKPNPLKNIKALLKLNPYAAVEKRHSILAIRRGVKRKSVVITRPLVTVFNEKNEKVSSVKLPAVFRAPIRPDIVSFIHHEIAKNNRQPYSVSKLAGHQTSAESWGTGRAVARIPRVRGGGTHRSGQATVAFHLQSVFAIRDTRRMAASGVPSLVFARGHAIQQLSEIPFVVSDKIQEYVKTKQACFFLKKSKIWPEIEKVLASKRFRAGRGKMRNRRRIQKRGPLIIYDRDQGLTRAFRNIPGIDLQNVNNMNLLRLAPGGHVGRLCVWTESAFRKLDDICGTWKTPSKVKTGFIFITLNLIFNLFFIKFRVHFRICSYHEVFVSSSLPRHIMQMTDLQRLINSEEVKKVVRKPRRKVVRRTVKPNPLKNIKALLKLNPYAAVEKRHSILAIRRGVKRKAGYTDKEKAIIKRRAELKQKAKAAKAKKPKQPKKAKTAKPAVAPAKSKAAKPAGAPVKPKATPKK